MVIGQRGRDLFRESQNSVWPYILEGITEPRVPRHMPIEFIPEGQESLISGSPC